MPVPRSQLANALRALSMDAVEKARSGHPGAPMGLADLATVLWRDYLRHNPGNPRWPDRDRFVLSNGHASMLLYALLHLSGYEVSLNDLKQFRQLHSKTPGHPEYGVTPGVETTTGPLGQGFANAVGMALAERTLAAQFNRPGLQIVNHHTYVIVGDGCLMEGVSHEACSLAGTLKLGKLIAFYDANGVSIDGAVDAWFTDDTPARFRACNWHVADWVDGHDPDAVARGIIEARKVGDAPSLIPCRTVIGKGAPGKEGDAGCHGAPLGADEIAAARAALGWTHPPFAVPDEICKAWDAREKGAAMAREWEATFADYKSKHPDLAAEFERRIAGDLPADWDASCARRVAAFAVEQKSQATRKASGRMLDALAADLPELLGGSADLAESNCVQSASRRPLHAHADGDYIHFGVREFGMSAIASGIALHGGFIPYVATFLVFSDYARNAIRLASLMRLRVLYVMTHDSVALGEDGPTHQPIEHLASLRLIPHLDVWRPCDLAETAVAWHALVARTDGPGVIALSRQGLPPMEYTEAQLAAIRRGAYVSRDTDGAPRIVLIATGSEVALAHDAAQTLDPQRKFVRVVSMPCAEVFDRQSDEWRDAVLPRNVPRVAVEAAAGAWWHRYVGERGAVVGLDDFGVSAPGGEAYEHLGFHSGAVAQAAESVLSRSAEAPNRATG